MDSNPTAPRPDPATKGPAICPHVWTQLTPEKAQCQTCLLIVPTVPVKEQKPGGR